MFVISMLQDIRSWKIWVAGELNEHCLNSGRCVLDIIILNLLYSYFWVIPHQGITQKEEYNI
jgi:hypothetical protein